MDEILSSIRQIIADDDATAPRRPTPVDLTAAGTPPSPGGDAMPRFGMPADVEPLALSADQIVADDADDDEHGVDLNAAMAVELAAKPEAGEFKADFLDPEDIAFDPEPEASIAPIPTFAPRPAMAPRPAPAAAVPSPVPAPSPRPRPTAAQAAPMPDPMLSSDIAEELLDPATNAAVRANFARLNNLGLGNSGLTIEAMMREMLKPMIKEWLDEHLPTVVERMVEREISRISRGVE